MGDNVIRKIAKRVISCQDTELAKLKKKVKTLEENREKWQALDEDPLDKKTQYNLFKNVRKNGSYSHFFDEVREVIDHFHLFHREMQVKYDASYFEQNKKLHVKFYGVHKWNSDTHIMELEGDFEVISVEAKHDREFHTILLKNLNAALVTPQKVPSQEPVNKEKLDDHVYRHTYDHVKHLELSYRGDELILADRVYFNEQGQQNGCGSIVSRSDTLAALYIWCTPLK
jgi:hypothetical protein